jgi:hypothetical protein
MSPLKASSRSGETMLLLFSPSAIPYYNRRCNPQTSAHCRECMSASFGSQRDAI